MSSGFVGAAVAGAIIGLILPRPKTKVDTCIQAYYADKYNGDKFGNPNKSFIACMKVNYKKEFDEANNAYEPAKPVEPVQLPPA